MNAMTRFFAVALIFFFIGALPAQSVRVLFVSGDAALQRPDEPALRPAQKGESVVVGTRIVTGADGRVMLTPLPGVQSIIAPNTTIVVEEVASQTTAANQVTHRAVLNLQTGAVTTDIDRQDEAYYDYSIRTVRGLAGARGTNYTVAVNRDGVQTVFVAHGRIEIMLADGQIFRLEPGQISLTGSDGMTRSATSLGDLPAPERVQAETVIEVALDSLVSAIESGLNLQPAALRNALDAATGLGFELSPDLRQAVERTLESTPQNSTSLQDELAGSLGTSTPNSTILEQAPTQILTESRLNSTEDPENPTSEDPQPTPRELYLHSLSPTQRSTFDALTLDAQSILISRLADTELQAFAYTPIEGHLPTSAEILYYADLTSETLRATFAARSPALRLALLADPSLRDFLLEPDPRTGLPRSDAVINHYFTLPDEATKASYLSTSATLQARLAELNEPGLTRYILVDYQATLFGAPLDEGGLANYLQAVINLRANSQTNYTFYKTLAGGDAFNRIQTAPDPQSWSPEAFNRTRTSFENANVDLARLAQLGLGDALMETSGDYARALLDFLDTDARFISAPNQVKLLDRLVELDWSRYLPHLITNVPLFEQLDWVVDFTTDDLDLIKTHRIGPEILQNYDPETKTFRPDSLLGSLRLLRTADPEGYALLRKIEDFSSIDTYYNPNPDGSDNPLDYGTGHTLATLANRLKQMQADGLLDDALRINFDAWSLAWADYSAIQNAVQLYRALDASERADALTAGLINLNPITNIEIGVQALRQLIAIWRQEVPDSIKQIVQSEAGSVFYWPNHLLSNQAPHARLLSDMAELIEAVGINAVKDLGLLQGIAYTDVLPENIEEAKIRLLTLVDSVNRLSPSERSLLRELQIIGHSWDKMGLLFTSTEGLVQLLRAYGLMDKAFILQTEQLDYPGPGIYDRSNSYFLAKEEGFYNRTLYSVSFKPRDNTDLHVGAIRNLILENTYSFYDSEVGDWVTVPTFDVPPGRDLYLRAGDLIDLNSITFSPGVRGIYMQAVTINLANLDFPEGSRVALTSRDGGLNFGSSIVGQVNFIQNVSYGGHLMDSQASFEANSRGNIAIGSFANPAVLPLTYTPPPPQAQ